MRVPVISLEALIERVPLAAIDFIKIDAQGLDLMVAQSIGKMIRHVKRLTLEVQDLPHGHEHMLVKNQANKDDAVQWFGQQGFKLDQCEVNNPHIKEENCHFINQRLEQRALPIVLPKQVTN